MPAAVNLGPRRAAALVVGLLAAIYLAVNLGLPRVAGSFVGPYVIQPALWLALAAVIFFLMPRYRTAGKLKDKGGITALALMFGFFQVLLCVVGGLFSSFGKSPYAFTPTSVLTNFVYISAMLVGLEVSRAWLVNHLGARHTFLAVTAVAVLYAVLFIPLNQITTVRPQMESITFINSTLLPTLAESLLATFLALLAGPAPALAYRGIVQAFWWFSPVLPDLPWAFKGLIGTALPIIGMVVLNSLYSPQPRRYKSRVAREGSLAGWIVTTVVAVGVIWFAVGLFPIHPSLIGSGSMSPTFNVGDVVIIARIAPESIKVGDVIQFKVAKGVSVMHRLHDITEVDGKTMFITKGDANSAPDEDPVLPENVLGREVFNLPKVGWLAVVVKSFFSG